MSEKGVLNNLKRCTRQSEPFDSVWERDYMHVLESDETVLRWERCRSLRIRYKKANGNAATYNPDFIIERVGGGKELHEVKGGHLLHDPDTQLKFAAGIEYCRKRGMVFKVITRPE